MASELKADCGLANAGLSGVNILLYSTSMALLSTIAATESPSSSGIYVATMPAESLGNYFFYAVNASGTRLSSLGSISWNGSSEWHAASSGLQTNAIDLPQLSAAFKTLGFRAYFYAAAVTSPVTADTYCVAGTYQGTPYYQGIATGNYVWSDGTYWYNTSTAPSVAVPAGYFKTAAGAKANGAYVAQGTATGTPGLAAHGNSIAAAFQPEQSWMANVDGNGYLETDVEDWHGANVTGMPMPTYAQPVGFLAATFPLTISSYAGADTAGTTTLLSRLPSALSITSGNVNANVQATAAALSFNLTGNITGSLSGAVNLPAIPANWITAAGIAASALNGKGDWLLASSYTAAPTAGQVAAAILANPSYLLATDSAGKVGVNNLPVEFLTSAEQTELTTAVNDLVSLLGRSDAAANVSSILTAVTNLTTRLPQAVLFDGSGNIKSTPQTNVTVGAFVAGAITAAAFSGAAINSTVAPNLDAAISSRSAPGAQMDLVNSPNATALSALLAAIFDTANTIEAETFRAAMRQGLAVLAGTSSNGGTTFNGVGTSTPRVTATVDSNSNRTAITLG